MRYIVVADAINLMAQAWGDKEAFWTEARDALNRTLAADLPAIVEEPDEDAATSLARSLREAVGVTIRSYPPL